VSKLGKGIARRAVYQAIQDDAFVMFALGERGQGAYGIIKMLWESAVSPDAKCILCFRQVDLNLEASVGL
jgi:hypothetical protein